MALSPSGLGTLLALIFAGPIIYATRYVYKKYRRRGHNDATEVEAEGLNEENGKEGDEDDHNKMTTNEYLFALVGYAIGIGNVWRFPYVIATNGGSAALLAYIICAIFVAVSLYHQLLHN